MVARQNALDHVGAIQAVDAIHAEHATLAIVPTGAAAVEAEALEILADLLPQQDQPVAFCSLGRRSCTLLAQGTYFLKGGLCFARLPRNKKCDPKMALCF